MGPKLQGLLELQDIELQIVDIRRQLARRERAVKAQGKKLDDLHRALESQRGELQRAQIQMDEADLDLKSRTSHIGRLRERLNSVRTNKEYAAVLSELNNEKADASKIETRALEMMAALDQQKSSLAEQRQTEEKEVQRLADVQAQLDQAKQAFAEKLAALQKQRKLAAEEIDQSALVLFDRLSERYDGEALAQIERTHPRRDEFVCNGCFMSLSAEVANACLTHDEVVTCNNCGRILWMEKGS
ncbi:MAG: hypothetical protein JXO22_12320 [Phycisphaerae bacterium]|nr:hypothetical protein [Phycisphaerae bacterium]